ncbi:hypothetical protein Tco_0073183 [Tanacetum coccineum]
MKQNRKYVAIVRLKPKYVIGVTSGVEENLNGDGGWQDVRKSNRNRASTSNNVDQQYINGYGFGYRGGYNVRGRGGMNGKGGLSGGRGGVYQRENNKGVGMKFVPVRNVGKRADNVQVMKCEGSGNRANKGKHVNNAKSGTFKKINEKSQVTIKNSFNALVDKSVEIGGDEWTQMRGKIDLATELGMQIDESKKKRWSEDLIKYYADNCKAKARQNLIAGLKWRIAKLKQDIVHGNTYVSKVANEDAKKQCVALMKTGGITRNQAFGKIYDETYRSELIEAKMMKGVFKRGRVTKNIIEVIYDDEGNTIHGSNMVDAFKLDAEAVMDLIKPISDCEIKVMLFDIEDNKASGPDGYSSKFFKAAWSVVGRDTYSAIREFFTSGKLLGERVKAGGSHFPYLFTLVMEVLNLMVIRQVKAEKRFKYHWGCKELKITSLCFVDDLLMLCHGDLISASVLRRGLDEFCVSSSLRPSMSKNEAFFRNVSDKVIDDIKLVMPFKVGALPIKYLGVPMMSKRLTSKDCKPMIEMIKKRMGIGEIRGESNRGMASVAWKEVCKPKSQGGLGLKPVHL